MSWWAVGITAAMGVKKGMDNESKMKDNAKARKAAITYSPWTGMGDPGGGPELPGALESGVQGGLTGAMIGTSMKGAGGAAPASSNTVNAQGLSVGGAEQVGKLEGLKFSPQEMNSMPGGGTYTAMGPQPGSAGALGAQQEPPPQMGMGMQQPQDPNNPLLKYSFMGQYNK